MHTQIQYGSCFTVGAHMNEINTFFLGFVRKEIFNDSSVIKIWNELTR